MGRIRYTPNRVFKEVVLARKCLGKTWFGCAESDTHPTVSSRKSCWRGNSYSRPGPDGQSQIHTQSCLEVMLTRKLLGKTRIERAESDTHPVVS